MDDYALEREFRNDRQLLFELGLAPGRMASMRAHPIQLDFARTRPADAEARSWIRERFAAMCGELGTRTREDGDWIRILRKQTNEEP